MRVVTNKCMLWDALWLVLSQGPGLNNSQANRSSSMLGRLALDDTLGSTHIGNSSNSNVTNNVLDVTVEYCGDDGCWRTKESRLSVYIRPAFSITAQVGRKVHGSWPPLTTCHYVMTRDAPVIQELCFGGLSSHQARSRQGTAQVCSAVWVLCGSLENGTGGFMHTFVPRHAVCVRRACVSSWITCEVCLLRIAGEWHMVVEKGCQHASIIHRRIQLSKVPIIA